MILILCYYLQVLLMLLLFLFFILQVIFFSLLTRRYCRIYLFSIAEVKYVGFFMMSLIHVRCKNIEMYFLIKSKRKKKKLNENSIKYPPCVSVIKAYVIVYYADYNEDILPISCCMYLYILWPKALRKYLTISCIIMNMKMNMK